MGTKTSKLKNASLNNTPYFSLNNKTFDCKVIDVQNGHLCSVAIIYNNVTVAFKITLIGYKTLSLNKNKNDTLNTLKFKIYSGKT